MLPAQLMGEEPNGVDGGDGLRKGDVCRLLACHAHPVGLAIEIHAHGDQYAPSAHRRDLRDGAIDDIPQALVGRQPSARAAPDEVDRDPRPRRVRVA
jgi:hypothetical protein